jgi:glycosyltransferase involved in cell wall biosynthesis
MTQDKIKCSVGITAYNEEANIGRLLQAVIDQRLYEVRITEIIVVASGCTDRTQDIVQEYMELDPRIQLHVQEKREGKTSAINVFLAHASEKVCVLESGDTLPREDTLENMVRMFRDPAVGMTGAQKVAVNTPDHVVGVLSHLRLQMEH